MVDLIVLEIEVFEDVKDIIFLLYVFGYFGLFGGFDFLKRFDIYLCFVKVVCSMIDVFVINVVEIWFEEIYFEYE